MGQTKQQRQLKVLERCDAASRNINVEMLRTLMRDNPYFKELVQEEAQKANTDKVIVDSIATMLASAGFTDDEPFAGSDAVDILTQIHALMGLRR